MSGPAVAPLRLQHASATASCRQFVPFQNAQSRRSSSCRGFVDNVKRVGKQVQGGLPIIGLISRLTSPSGGFDQQTYPEFCRAWMDARIPKLDNALYDLEQRHDQRAGRRNMLLYLWMVKEGCGILRDDYFIFSARRLHASCAPLFYAVLCLSLDLEAEMGRFEQNLDNEKQKYSMLEMPSAAPERQATLALDCLATCGLGLRDGMLIPDEDKQSLEDILQVAFESVSTEQLQQAIATRSSRMYD